MRTKAIQATLCLVLVAKNVYQAGERSPRASAVFAALWGMLAGAYLTEILVEVTQ